MFRSFLKKNKNKVRPRFELGSWDSESQVLTITPSNQLMVSDLFCMVLNHTLVAMITKMKRPASETIKVYVTRSMYECKILISEYPLLCCICTIVQVCVWKSVWLTTHWKILFLWGFAIHRAAESKLWHCVIRDCVLLGMISSWCCFDCLRYRFYCCN